MKGDLHVRFCEKFEVKLLLLIRLRGRENLLYFPSYSINKIIGKIKLQKLKDKIRWNNTVAYGIITYRLWFWRTVT